MKKSQKGLTLVEVIVSIAVFTIISLALFSSFLGMKRVTVRQEEYVRLEMVCYDLKYEWEMYGVKHFNDEKNTKYLGSDFNIIQISDSSDSGDLKNAKYLIKYTINENGELIINRISDFDEKKVFIKDLNCGTSSANLTNAEEEQANEKK